MQKVNLYANGTHTVFNCIIEPLKETDEVYVVSNGKVYKWDNTVTETATEYLKHFKEVSVNNCPLFNNCSCSDSNVSFTDIVEKEVTKLKIKYESNSKNPFKTESYLLDHFVKHCDIFPNNCEKVTITDDIHRIVEWVINVDKSIVMNFIPDEYKDLQDNEELKRVLESAVTISLKEDRINKLIAIVKAVKDCCDKLKVAKESKRPSNNKEEKKSGEA